MKHLSLSISCLFLAAVVSAAIPPGQPSGSSVLLRCFVEAELVDQVASGVLIPSQHAEVNALLKEWGKQRRRDIQLTLSDRFGREARPRFGEFAETFVESQAENDLGYLERLVSELDYMDRGIESYADLREDVARRWLRLEIEEAADLLGEIQTWAKLKEKGAEPPPLKVWLKRDAEPADALAAAEVPFAELPQSHLPQVNALGTFSKRQKERRDRQVQQATADMAQIARERRQAEEEAAQEELLAAQAEAEAMVRHAQDLAEVEKLALEQRKNGFESKLKKLVKTTISSTVGAFTGDLGRRAGEALANSLFGD